MTQCTLQWLAQLALACLKQALIARADLSACAASATHDGHSLQKLTTASCTLIISAESCSHWRSCAQRRIKGCLWRGSRIQNHSSAVLFSGVVSAAAHVFISLPMLFVFWAAVDQGCQSRGSRIHNNSEILLVVGRHDLLALGTVTFFPSRTPEQSARRKCNLTVVDPIGRAQFSPPRTAGANARRDVERTGWTTSGTQGVNTKRAKNAETERC